MFLQVLLRVLPSSDLWQSTLQFAALLLLPALGGLVSERSGVTNIAQEGMMLTGAYAGVMTTLFFHNVILDASGTPSVLGAQPIPGFTASAPEPPPVSADARTVPPGV